MGSLTFTENDFSCHICVKSFNCDIQTPRMLLCGHTFCQSCLEHILNDNVNCLCSNCRESIAASSTEDIPVNRFLLSLITKTENKSSKEESNISKELEELSLKKDYCFIKKEDKVPSVGHCEEHDCPINFKCLDCSQCICGTCAFFLHKTCSRILPIADAVNVIKEEGLKKLMTVKKKYSDILSKTEEEIQSLEITSETIKQEIVEKKSLGMENYKVFEKLSRKEFEIKQMTSIQEVDKAMKELELFLEELDDTSGKCNLQFVSCSPTVFKVSLFILYLALFFSNLICF